MGKCPLDLEIQWSLVILSTAILQRQQAETNQEWDDKGGGEKMETTVQVILDNSALKGGRQKGYEWDIHSPSMSGTFIHPVLPGLHIQLFFFSHVLTQSLLALISKYVESHHLITFSTAAYSKPPLSLAWAIFFFFFFPWAILRASEFIS